MQKLKEERQPPSGGNAAVLRWRTGVRHKKPSKNQRKNCKKRLTNGAGDGNICKLSDERRGKRREGAKTSKKLEKKRKKLLTIGLFGGRLNEFTAARLWTASVPCKLNNEKTN